MSTILGEWETANPKPAGAQAMVAYNRARMKLLRSHGWSGRTNRTCFDTEKANREEADRRRRFEAWADQKAREAGFASRDEHIDHIISTLKDS